MALDRLAAFGSISVNNLGGGFPPTDVAVVVPVASAPPAIVLAASVTGKGQADAELPGDVWARVVVWSGEGPQDGEDDYLLYGNPGSSAGIRGRVIFDAAVSQGAPLVLPQLVLPQLDGPYLVVYMTRALSVQAVGAPVRRVSLSATPAAVLGGSDYRLR